MTTPSRTPGDLRMSNPTRLSDEEYAAHIRALVDEAPPLPQAARDLWRRATEGAAANHVIASEQAAS